LGFGYTGPGALLKVTAPGGLGNGSRFRCLFSGRSQTHTGLRRKVGRQHDDVGAIGAADEVRRATGTPAARAVAIICTQASSNKAHR
jgi:hypothetical protein